VGLVGLFNCSTRDFVRSVVVLWNWVGTNAWMSDWREALANFAENLSECDACCQYVIPCSLGCCRNILDNMF
jgi:hypothetical protein